MLVVSLGIILTVRFLIHIQQESLLQMVVLVVWVEMVAMVAQVPHRRVALVRSVQLVVLAAQRLLVVLPETLCWER
jgi:hypothetical protein